MTLKQSEEGEVTEGEKCGQYQTFSRKIFFFWSRFMSFITLMVKASWTFCLMIYFYDSSFWLGCVVCLYRTCCNPIVWSLLHTAWFVLIFLRVCPVSAWATFTRSGVVHTLHVMLVWLNFFNHQLLPKCGLHLKMCPKDVTHFSHSVPCKRWKGFLGFSWLSGEAPCLIVPVKLSSPIWWGIHSLQIVSCGCSSSRLSLSLSQMLCAL